ncbi:hypothetical protein P4646_25945 [Peribacillus simplex]|uniref:hypothetical protein n=1 Tax=Peribacillus simplex TaxID=1478 RepID=UPI002E24F664|nr:hypothetical protein [Peribacillus simplex]MED4092856.1 hypothetical protein [Peribacillus simplex]
MRIVSYGKVKIELDLHPAFPLYAEEVLKETTKPDNPRSPNMHPSSYNTAYEKEMPWFDKNAMNNVGCMSSYDKLMLQMSNRLHNANHIEEIDRNVRSYDLFKYETGLLRYGS